MDETHRIVIKIRMPAKKTMDAAISSERNGKTPLVSFRGRPMPNEGFLAGYSALIDRYDLAMPLPHEVAAVSPRNLRHKADGWVIHPVGLHPADTDVGHLVFALKHEGVRLLILRKLFAVFDPAGLARALRLKPTSAYLRRLCHLYEWLGGPRLDAPDTAAGIYVDLINAAQQYGTAHGGRSRRFRINHNVAGTPDFCPLVFRTHKLDVLLAKGLEARARAVVDAALPETVARAAAFLLLSDSKASFAIEGEDPPRDRVQRWGVAIGQAGRWRFGVDALVALQRSLIDDRLVRLGLRQEGGFIGRRDAMNQPVPEHISAKAADLPSLLEGLVAFADRARAMGFDPVLTAACVAFGFVYIHPFEDGNGRIHRFLMHHVLADRGFTPPEIVFPISSTILGAIVEYKGVLEGTSRPLLDWIDWRPTAKGNVDVTVDSADFYRFFDATAHAEFLFECIERSVETALPEELGFLQHRDAFHRRVGEILDMSERTVDLLLRFLQQNHGTLSKRARTREFAALDEDEVQRLQAAYGELFTS